MSKLGQDFHRNLAIVEGRAPLGVREYALRQIALQETTITGIVPLTPLVPGAISGAVGDVALQLPSCLEQFTDAQIYEMIHAAERKGISAEHFFQIADELGEAGVRELLGEEVLSELLGALAGGALGALAGGPLGAIAGAHAGHAIQKHLNNPDRLKKKAKLEKWKAAHKDAKASHQQAKADVYRAKADKVRAKADFKAAKAEGRPKSGPAKAEPAKAEPAKAEALKATPKPEPAKASESPKHEPKAASKSEPPKPNERAKESLGSRMKNLLKTDVGAAAHKVAKTAGATAHAYTPTFSKAAVGAAKAVGSAGKAAADKAAAGAGKAAAGAGNQAKRAASAVGNLLKKRPDPGLKGVRGFAGRAHAVLGATKNKQYRMGAKAKAVGG